MVRAHASRNGVGRGHACSRPAAGASCDVPASRNERKLATILFADLVDSTGLVEREDPEVVQAVVGRAFDQAAREIERHGGLIEKFIGDAVLAVFGLPSAHEDDSERAVRAALAIRAVMIDLRRQLASEGQPGPELRIGIEAGEVLVNLERVQGARDRMLTGTAVNTAARLQEAAAPGQILVGPAVHDATRDQFEYRKVAPMALRGKAAAVAAWLAVRAKAPLPGLRAPLRLQARLVGRSGELAYLGDALRRVDANRLPVLVTVTGPAGIGKSRLVHEFIEPLDQAAGRVRVRKGRCRSYGDGSYAALAEAMRQECGVFDDDAPHVVERKASVAIQRLTGTPELADPLAVLLGGDGGRRLRREDLFDAWRRILECMAADTPLVLVLEDVHWADDGLLDFIEHVADWSEAPILLLVIARPELLRRRPAWTRDRRDPVTIELAPLSRDDTAALAEDLLAPDLSDDLARLIPEASEGNPLFAEEIVSTLLDRGHIRQGRAGRWELVEPPAAVDVPRSIHAIIEARLDALPGPEKAMLQDASVIGRTFWASAVESLSGERPGRVRAILRSLEAKGLVARSPSSSLSGERELAFHHALIRDVAYDTLPKAQRAERHEAAARWVEAQAGPQGDEWAALLATHHLQALRWLDDLGESNGRRSRLEREGYRWARVAGERARRVWQQREAVRWLDAALDLGERAGLADAEMAALWEAYARAADGIAGHAEIVRAWEEAQARYARLGLTGDLGRAEASMAHACLWTGRATATHRLARRAVARLEPMGEGGDLAFALFVLGRHLLERGDIDHAEPLLRRATGMAGSVGDRATAANATIALGWALHARRRGAETVRLFEDALEAARAAGDLVLLLDALEAVLSAAIEVNGDYARAELLCREATDVARRSGNLHRLSRAHLNLGYLMVETGRLDRVEGPLQSALDAAGRTGDPTLLASIHGELAVKHCLSGELERAHAAFDARRTIFRQARLGAIAYSEEFDGLIAAYLAMGDGRPEEAARILTDAQLHVNDARLSVWEGQTLLFECVRALVALERPAEAAGPRDRLARLAASNVPPRAFLAWADGLIEPDPARARPHLAEAVLRFETLGRRIDLGRCLVDLARTARASGDDPAPTLARARRMLEEAGAGLFLPVLSGGQHAGGRGRDCSGVAT